MKELILILFVAVGFLFGCLFERQMTNHAKVKAIETAQQNTAQVAETSNNIKERIQHADKNCSDIFNIDISGCVQ